jgi:hypothetical protein
VLEKNSVYWEFILPEIALVCDKHVLASVRAAVKIKGGIYDSGIPVSTKPDPLSFREGHALAIQGNLMRQKHFNKPMRRIREHAHPRVYYWTKGRSPV